MLCRPSWPGNYYVGQCDFKVMALFLPLAPQCCGSRQVHHARLQVNTQPLRTGTVRSQLHKKAIWAQHGLDIRHPSETLFLLARKSRYFLIPSYPPLPRNLQQRAASSLLTLTSLDQIRAPSLTSSQAVPANLPSSPAT